MSKKIGKVSKPFTMHVKGLEAGYHEPRLVTSLSLGYMISPTGADHRDSFGGGKWNTEATISQLYPMGIYKTIPKDDMTAKGITFFILGQLNFILNNSLNECICVPFTPALNVRLLTAITGWEMSISGIFKTAERILTLTRLFNIRQGLTSAHDMLPERYFQPKINGSLSYKALNKDTMLKARDIYYSLLGWDAKGVPTVERVASLLIK